MTGAALLVHGSQSVITYLGLDFPSSYSQALGFQLPWKAIFWFHNNIFLYFVKFMGTHLLNFLNFGAGHRRHKPAMYNS